MTADILICVIYSLSDLNPQSLVACQQIIWTSQEINFSNESKKIFECF